MNNEKESLERGLFPFSPDSILEIGRKRLKCNKSAPFNRNSEQGYGYRRKGGTASGF